VSDHLSRKELRTDRFAVAVEHNFEFLAGHRQQVVRYGAVALIAIAAAAGTYYYLDTRK